MSGANGSYQDVDIDLGRVAAALWERKGRILAVTALAAVGALVVTSLMTPSYKAETRLLIESRSPNLTGADANAANDPVLDALNITSQAQILQSTDLIRRVARELNLAKYKEFDPAAKSLVPDLLVLTGLKPDPMSLDPEDRVVEKFREKLQVYAVENSRVIAIEFSSHDPKLSAAVPNKMAEVYLQIQSGAKIDNHEETAKWLEPEIASLTQKVKDAERKVADYRSQNGLFQTNGASSFSSQQLNDISAELTRVRGDRANAEARAQNVRAALKAGRSPDTISEVSSSQVIQRLKETETNLQAQISDLSTTLLDGHPRLKGLRAQLAQIRQQIANETQKVLAGLDSEADVARLREQQLVSQLNALKADSARSGEEEVGLRALEREATAQRQLLETYLSRYREATSKLDGNATPADARIVSQAVEPSEPFFPKIIPIIVVITLATLIVSCLIVMISELFSGRALRPVNRDADSFPHRAHDEAGRDEPVVAAVPALAPVVAREVVVHPATPEPASLTPEPVVEAAVAPAPEPEIRKAAIAATRVQPPVEHVAAKELPAAVAVSADLPQSEASEPPRAADTSFTIGSVAHYLQRHAIPVAIAVSPAGDDGSTATVMLARAVAETARTVILVDLTGSACPTRLMAEHDRLAGITDLLCGETAFGDAIHRDRLSDAHIVPQGVSDVVRAMRAADRLTIIIDALSDAYDLVLIECGPADIASLKRLVRGENTEIILSVPGFREEAIANLVVTYADAGFPNLLVMAQGDDHQTPSSRRSSAA
ncbi:exopolysaccharide transport family protein [Neorhizobium sp. NCHU2750]|uniref:GumC family protein n=1 Tax=Neorhizobium sp. NCHU2750 TaxID=1825976 RepID=UPI000E75E58C|nr:chain-length determining protein [Neorhizobium sp. NCHU2750]